MTEVGLRRITIFGTGFYNLICRSVNSVIVSFVDAKILYHNYNINFSTSLPFFFKKKYLLRLSVKALAGPCRTEPTIVTEVGLRRITIFGTGFYNLICRSVNSVIVSFVDAKILYHNYNINFSTSLPFFFKKKYLLRLSVKALAGPNLRL